jgi:hypothetical protein
MASTFSEMDQIKNISCQVWFLWRKLDAINIIVSIRV